MDGSVFVGYQDQTLVDIDPYVIPSYPPRYMVGPICPQEEVTTLLV